MLEKVDFPLTNGQISEFILEKGYTNYFKLQQAISEMMDADLIRKESVHKRTLYHLTPEGRKSIEYFHNKISPAIQSDIDSFLAEKNYDLKNDVAVKSDYYRNTNQEWSVHMRVLENQMPLIDLTITVPTEKEAETMSNNWSSYNQEVYADIMAKLLR